MKKFVLVTGASGDIGREIALTLAESGYSLYLHYHQNKRAIEILMDDLQSISSENEYIPIQADLMKETGITKLCREIYQLYGIVHNSGITMYKLLENMLNEEVADIIQLNLISPILITKQLLSKMIPNQQGNIVFISSIWGQTGASCETVYSAAKGGQIAFAKALSKELGLSQIRVNVVAPGAIRSKMIGHLNREEITGLEDDIPMGRLGNPKNVAHAVEFLLSDRSSYITGQVLGVNGGWYE